MVMRLSRSCGPRRKLESLLPVSVYQQVTAVLGEAGRHMGKSISFIENYSDRHESQTLRNYLNRMQNSSMLTWPLTEVSGLGRLWGSSVNQYGYALAERTFKSIVQTAKSMQCRRERKCRLGTCCRGC